MFLIKNRQNTNLVQPTDTLAKNEMNHLVLSIHTEIGDDLVSKNEMTENGDTRRNEE
jgi:hypothetical protein